MKLHGLPYDRVWTKLSRDVESGTNLVYLEEAVDWELGTEIIITTTSYEFDQTETNIITDILNNGLTLKLQYNIQYKHLGKNN